MAKKQRVQAAQGSLKGETIKRLSSAWRQFQLKDLIAPFIFLTLFLPAKIFKIANHLKHRKLWLVAEEGEARDNGYYFYKHVREQHSDDFCFYAIKKISKDYQKVAKLGNVINFGSLKHWFYYLAADLNISSQKSGNPNPIFFYFLHVVCKLYNNRVFLQHGIIKDDAKWVYFSKTRFKYFVCGTPEEYNYVKTTFGYPEGNVILTGLPRWDSLDNQEVKKTIILVMPTWRSWLGKDFNGLHQIKDFRATEYYQRWNSFLHSQKLLRLAEAQNLQIYFYPHANMQKFLGYFQSPNQHVKIIDQRACDIQTALKTSALLVTDYSSVFMDFAYLEKPSVYYQFDEQEYRKKQYQQGYFDYRKNGFGDVCTTEDEVVEKIIQSAKNGFKIEPEYHKRSQNFFTLKDQQNSERVYEAIK